MDELLNSDQIQIERKIFYFDLKENPRGRFLRITEDVNGRRDAIIVPASGLAGFVEALNRAIEFDEEAAEHVAAS